MSTLIVEVCKIEEVHPHDNADRLEIVKVKGWYCVTGKGQYKVNDACVYIPIDSILPKELEEKIFGKDSKITLDNGRVRTIKIRGTISQGLIVHPEIVGVETASIGTDVKDLLKITKFEPVETNVNTAKNPKSKSECNPNFNKYTDLEHLKNFNTVFKDSDMVYVSEKLHGTSFRCGWLSAEPITLIGKIKKFFNIGSFKEFCYGSRNVQLHEKTIDGKSCYNVYYNIVNQYGLKHKIGVNEVVYGEIVGSGIQGEYHYGLEPGKYRLFVYDVQVNGQFLDYSEFKLYCVRHVLDTVPELFFGHYNYEVMKSLTEGPSVVDSSQNVREGIVIKPLHETSHHKLGRKVLKFVSDSFLSNKNNTDFK